MEGDIKLENERIALWGPMSSGKTSLFHALIKKLAFLNNTDGDFYYEAINPETNFPYSVKEAEKPPPPNSWKITDDIIIVSRIPKNSGQYYGTSFDFNFRHHIHLQDYQGQYAVETASDHINTVLNSKNIIVTIDCARYDEYTDNLLVGLRRRLEEDKQHSKFRVVFCITKIDSFADTIPINPKEDRVEGGTPLAFLNNNVDIKLRDIAQQIQIFEGNQGKFECKSFFTSSVGVMATPEKQIANFNGTWVKDLNKWNPTGVTKPFFWIFDKVEEEYINKKKKNEPFFAKFRNQEIKRIPWYRG